MTLTEILTDTYQKESTFDLLLRLLNGPGTILPGESVEFMEPAIMDALKMELRRRFDRCDALFTS